MTLIIASLLIFALLGASTGVEPDKKVPVTYGEPATAEEPTEPEEDKPLRVIVEEPEENTNWVTELNFDENDPKDWEDYYGQEKVKQFLQLQIDVLRTYEGLKVMLIASKGTGKTTLARIVAKKVINKRGGRYIEITPAMIESKKRLDDLMNTLKRGDIIFIDEIHMFSRKVADTLLPAIEDNMYPFNNGMIKLPRAISWIGATTDVGMLPEAFQDRFQLLSLSALTEENLKKVLFDLDHPINEEAAGDIAHRAVGSPRELKKVYKVARDVATRNGSPIINGTDTEEAFYLLDLDENGLYSQDRLVLHALKNNPKRYASGKERHAHSERAIRALTGLDDSLYRDQIEPKLLRKGYITISTGGRELTERGWNTYFGGKPENVQ